MTITDNLPARRALIAVVHEPTRTDNRLPVQSAATQLLDEGPAGGLSRASVAGIFIGMAGITGAALAFTQYVA